MKNLGRHHRDHFLGQHLTQTRNHAISQSTGDDNHLLAVERIERFLHNVSRSGNLGRVLRIGKSRVKPRYDPKVRFSRPGAKALNMNTLPDPLSPPKVRC
jgi:hypothetical protein